MVYIIVRKGKRSGHRWTGQRKDYLHQRRKELVEKIKEGIMSKSEMNRGDEGNPEFDERVEKYDRWRKEKEPLTKELADINREFKKNKTEGRPHTLDDLRSDGPKLKYD